MESWFPCLGEHVKQSVLNLISTQSCRITVPLDYESEGTENAPVFAHTLVQYLLRSFVVTVETACRSRNRLDHHHHYHYCNNYNLKLFYMPQSSNPGSEKSSISTSSTDSSPPGTPPAPPTPPARPKAKSSTARPKACTVRK